MTSMFKCKNCMHYLVSYSYLTAEDHYCDVYGDIGREDCSSFEPKEDVK